MTEAEIYAGLTDLLRDIFLRDDLTARPELSAAEVEGWDSFKQIEIIMASEERFGVKFTTRDVDGLRQLKDLVRLILAKRP